MNIEIAKNRIGQVLRIDSIDSTDSDFLATHIPFRKIAVKAKNADQIEETYRSEEDIYKDIFENEHLRDQHQLVIVEGPSGAGKSHFIRWLNAKLNAQKEKEVNNEVVLLICRSNNTLKGTLRQLLAKNEVKEIANKQAYDRLLKATRTISEGKFRSTIYHQFIVEIENDTSEKMSSTKRRKLIALLNNSLFQDKLMSAGGPIDRIYSKITSSSSNFDNDVIAQFYKEDLTLDVDFAEQLEDADKKARDLANELIDGDNNEFIQKVTDYMNSFVETVIQTSAGIEPGDFQQIFKEIRQELKRKGKNLILLIEDITSFTGVNQALLNALVTGHTGSNAADGLCRIISVVGTTTQYYNQFRDNYRDRITGQITINDGVIGENKNDLVQFIAKYLNAMSLNVETLDEWERSGAYPEDFPVHNDDEHIGWDKFRLSAEKQISLFPFTQTAIINLYNAMPDHKTPRYILRDIVEPAVNEILYHAEAFPKFCIGWSSPLSEPVENRIGNIVQSLQMTPDEKADLRKRLVAFVGFWTNKTLDVSSNGYISGIRKELFSQFGFDGFVSKLTSLSDTKNADKYLPPREEPLPKAEIHTEQDTQAKTAAPAYNIDPKKQREYDNFKDSAISWHRDGKSLVRFIPIRDEISNFVYDAVNWQQEGVPLDSKNRFKDSVGGRLVGFERQDQGLDRCIVVFKDTDETYQLLLCFAKWLYLGNKSWNFPDSASAIFFATSWLQRNKDRFASVIKNVDSGASIPAYVKAAMIEKVYKQIINGKLENTKLERLGDETFLNVDISENVSEEYKNGHSKKWYELQAFIQNQGSDPYDASVRYFNLIQGDVKNTGTYVLNYSLYQSALKEIHRSGYVIGENEDIGTDRDVKAKREIYELTQKIINKVHKVVEDETTIAHDTAMKTLEYFKNIDTDDEFEAGDIRDIINNINDFYQKCYTAGINISYPDRSQLPKIKESASDIAKALNILLEEYKDEDDITVLCKFSANPIGKALPFLQILNKAYNDADIAFGQMNNEIESLKQKGSWNDNIDPRFEKQQKNFEDLLAELKEVQ